MQCVIPSCNKDNNDIPQGTAFHVFPTEPSLCAAWLQALNKEDWKPAETSVICSNHFIKNDLYIDTNGQCKIRPNAVPIVNLENVPNSDSLMMPCIVKVCRICFATDCKLYPMAMCNKLDQAYETLTGLTIENDDNLPSYLCAECAQRLLNCFHFRNRSLRAHLVLLEIIKKHDNITLESLKSTIGSEDLFRSNLRVSHNPVDHYDLKVEYVTSNDTENVITKDQEDTEFEIRLKNTVIFGIKTENDETSDQDVSYIVADLSGDVVRLKTEKDEMVRGCFSNDTTNEQTLCVDMLAGEHCFVEDKAFSEGVKQEIKDCARKVENVTNLPKHTSPQQNDKRFKRLREANSFEISELKCELCPYQTNNEYSFLSHLKNHAKSNLLNCKTNTKQHVKVRKYRSDRKTRSCHICKKIFKTACNLKRHIRIHSGEKPFSCEICRKAFKRQDHYKNHFKMHSEEKAYSCDVCNKEFSRQDHYKTHLKSHSLEKTYYVCDVCDKWFSRKSNLLNHMNLHTGEKPFSCEICSKMFRRNNNLQKHLKLHSKKPYSCDECKRCFIRKSDLKAHVRFHMDGGIHKCYKCKKIFSLKHNLRIHVKKNCIP